MQTISTLGELNQRHEASAAARSFIKWVAFLGSRDVTQPSAVPADLERFQRAAVTAMSTGDASALLAASRAYVQVITRRTILGRLTGTTNVPPLIQVPTTTADPAADWVAELAPIPATNLSVDTESTDATKLATILGVSTEWLRSTDDRALNLVDAYVTRALRLAEDRALLSSDAAVPSERPAGLLNGLSPVSPGSPFGAADYAGALWDAVRDGDALAPAFILSARGAMFLASLRDGGALLFPNVGPTGGNISGVQIIVSPAATNRLVLVDASCLAVVDDGLTVDRSTSSAVQLSTTPSAGAAALVSAFQGNLAFLKFVRRIFWKLLASDAVAYLELPIVG
jgi:HK97 family phage major capsid protein